MISETVDAAILPKLLTPVASIGFCLFTMKSRGDRSDHPVALSCEYNTPEATHLFAVGDISGRTGTDGL